MRRELISALHCPYTGSPFQVTAVSSQNASEIGLGVVRSEAGQFPIIAGVLRLLSDELRQPLAELATHGRGAEALATAFEVQSNNSSWSSLANRLWRVSHRRNLGVVAGVLRRSKQRLYRQVIDLDIAFDEFASKVGAKSWKNWQTYRFSMPTFQAVYVLSHLARGCRTVLDFGSGLGHAAFLISRLAPDARVICADYSFTALYLAKRFLVPDADCICLDGDYPLPFGDGDLDCVFSTDTLQYIESRLGLAKEFQRILSPDGRIVLPHLHNRLGPGRYDRALTARGYSGLFAGMPHRLYPEGHIVANYAAHDTLDLEQRWAQDDLDRALGGLSLVAATSQSIFRRYAGLLDTYLDAANQPRINPAYRTRRLGSTMLLERAVEAPYVVERRVQDMVLLPRTWKVDCGSHTHSELHGLRHLDRTQLRELARRFLVLELPDRWVSSHNVREAFATGGCTRP